MIGAEDAGVALGDVTLLSPVSFEVEAGRTLAVVGPNGSGKTTLLRVLAGQVSPSTGTVVVEGLPPDERRPAFRSRVASLLGVPPLARNLTLREYLTLIAISWGTDAEEAAQQADDLLEEFQIARLASRFPHELSSGQTQLYSLAVTLARPFEVLLLDEPEQRLDHDRLTLVGDALSRRNMAGATLVLASHSRPLVDRLADQVLALAEDGDDVDA
ncbi:ABC transporter ATP-binding protein [Kineosporiaceae bacterium SCSIO 59966]|nr:ABC transporter ATP-binding protein [Kineosporiaceae bacterium SCSIO 59966]